jgi:hypothetical protein
MARQLRPLLEGYRAAALALKEWGGGTRTGLVRAAIDEARRELARGQMTCGEAVSKVTLENAVAWLQGEGALVTLASDVLRVDDAWEQVHLPELTSELTRYLASA